MELNQKKKQLQQQLLSYYRNDKEKVKKVVEGCKLIGIPLNEEEIIDGIIKNPEAFTTIIGLVDFGVIPKLVETVKIIKRK